MGLSERRRTGGVQERIQKNVKGKRVYFPRLWGGGKTSGPFVFREDARGGEKERGEKRGLEGRGKGTSFVMGRME